MRPILATEDQNEYSEVWERLTDNGIPVFEPAKHSDVPGFKVGSRQRVICIWLDQQYEDAIQLLRDPNHIVKYPVDPEEFERLQYQVDENMERAVDGFSEKALNWIVALVLIAVFGWIAYQATK